MVITRLSWVGCSVGNGEPFDQNDGVTEQASTTEAHKAFLAAEDKSL